MQDMWSAEFVLDGITRFVLLDGDPKWEESEFNDVPWRTEDGSIVIADSNQDLVDWLAKNMPNAVLNDFETDESEDGPTSVNLDHALREADLRHTPVEAVLDGDLLITAWNFLDDVLRSGGLPFNHRGLIADKVYDKLFYSLNIEWMFENPLPPGYRYVPVWPEKERLKIYQVISIGIERFRPLIDSALNVSAAA